MPATSQLDKLISITAISVLSCFRTIPDWLRSFGVCIEGAPSVHISDDGYNFSPPPPIASFPLASPARFYRQVDDASLARFHDLGHG